MCSGQLQTIANLQSIERQVSAMTTKVGTIQEMQTNQQFALQKVQHDHRGDVQQLKFDLVEVANKWDLTTQREKEYCTHLTVCEKLGREGAKQLQLFRSSIPRLYSEVE